MWYWTDCFLNHAHTKGIQGHVSINTLDQPSINIPNDTWSILDCYAVNPRSTFPWILDQHSISIQSTLDQHLSRQLLKNKFSDTSLSVDRYIWVDPPSANYPPTVNQVSIEMSMECWSRVSTDTWPQMPLVHVTYVSSDCESWSLQWYRWVKYTVLYQMLNF